MDKNILLKDIDLNIFPECPIEFLHKDGTMGVICDRAGFKYITAAPLIEACEFIYDLNIRSISSGSNAINEIGVTIEYDSLSEENKKIINEFIERGEVKILTTKQFIDLRKVEYIRISIVVDENVDTISTAQEKMIMKLNSLGLQQQDVLFGRKTKDEAIKEIIKMTSSNVIKMIDGKVHNILTPTLGEDEAFEYLLELGDLYVEGEFWKSKELYNKHLDYIKGLEGNLTADTFE